MHLQRLTRFDAPLTDHLIAGAGEDPVAVGTEDQRVDRPLMTSELADHLAGRYIPQPDALAVRRARDASGFFTGRRQELAVGAESDARCGFHRADESAQLA